MKNTRNARAAKPITVLCLFSLAFFLAITPAKAERKGAELAIAKSDGGQLQGELIAVRGETLILLVGGLDASVDLGEIGHITVVRKSRALQGMGYGALAGLGAGLVTGLASQDDPPGFFSLTKSEKGMVAGILVGGLGVIIGLIGGATAGIDKEISVEKVETSKDKAGLLKYLDGLARVRSAA